MRKNTFICAEIWMFSGEWPISQQARERQKNATLSIEINEKKHTHTQEHDYEMKKRQGREIHVGFCFALFFFCSSLCRRKRLYSTIHAHSPRAKSPHTRAKKKALATQTTAITQIATRKRRREKKPATASLSASAAI